MTKERDHLFDNIKGLLIFLVVFGHLLGTFIFKHSEVVDTTYKAIYIFHMPLFVFISGYFSKKNNKTRILELILVYIFWQMIMFPLFTGKGVFNGQTSVFSPNWTYWYLLSLITWKIITPYFEKIKYSLPLSFILGILIGFSSFKGGLTILSLGRTFSFYPFFLLGYYTNKEHIEIIKNKVNKYQGLIAFIAIVLISLLIFNYIDDYLIKEKYFTKILYLNTMYRNYMNNEYIGALARTALYIIQVLAIPLIISFIPNKKTLLSKIGENTLFVYLSHSIIIQILKNNKTLIEIAPENGIYLLLFFSIIAFLYCLILSFKPIQKFGILLTSINMKYFIKEDNQEIKKLEK